MKVLISIDGGEAAEIVLKESAKFLAAFPGSEIHVFNVMDMASVAMGQGYDNTLLMQTMERQASDLKKTVANIFGSTPFEFSTQIGYPTEEILKKEKEYHCDLLIMGTHGRTGLDHLLIGSVAEKTLRFSECNVLVIPVKHKLSENS